MDLRVVAFVLGLLACGGASPTTTPPTRTPPATWRAETSEHFIVWTNTSPERARVLVQTMENLRQVVLGVSFFRREVRGKSFVIAFNDLDEVRQYVPPQFIARAWSGQNVLLQPVIILAASSLDHDRRIVTHELTHVIAFNAIAHQPDWFAEGLAGYFETVRLDESHATVDVGRPLENRLATIHQDGLTPAADVFACTRDECKDGRFYATTWAIVTYLITEHPTELMQYMTKLIETPADQQDGLWAAIFPTLPPAKLDHELRAWLRYGRVQVMQYKITLRDWKVTEAPISEADAFAAKAILRYLSTPKAGVPAEITKSLGLDATNVLANMIKTVAEGSITADLAHSITAAHPDDWRAWWLAWRATAGTAEAREAREKTCSLLEANPAAVMVEACSRDATGALAEDPRRAVFMAATPSFNPCLRKSKPSEITRSMTIDIDVADSGAVTSAHVTMGSPETNACIEKILQGLVFPPHHAGPLHLSSQH